MGTHFDAIPANDSAVTELSALQPTNPFATTAFFESKRRAGSAAWVLALREDVGGLQNGCGAFLRKGRLNRTLEICSLAAVNAESPFWDGLREFCRQHGVTKLELQTFASPPDTMIAFLGVTCTQRSRYEFVLDLAEDLDAGLSTNHRRNLRKAQKAGLTLRRTRSADAARKHQTLMSQSIDRRRARGETVESIDPSPEHVAFLQSCAGELFQAVRDEDVLSSVLVLRAPRGGYYQSAGTSPKGMAIGASHFLIRTIASELKADGALVFNLGGAEDSSNLARFKEGFGASRVPLPAASCYVGPFWRQLAGRVMGLARSNRAMLMHRLTGGFSRLIVYSTETGMIQAPESRADMELRRLTPADLRNLSVWDAAFRARQLERLSRFGASYAWAVLVNGKVAHVSWLLPREAIEKDVPCMLKPLADEAEITCCETLPEFGGLGIYGFAIRNLVGVARGQGIRRVFMKTTLDNKASQSGIEKVGLKRVGFAYLITMPVSGRLITWCCLR